jgi:hypothetical protein
MSSEFNFSENQYIVADNEALDFNFHYVRQQSELINDSVIKINVLHQGILKELYVNNIQIRTNITGLRIFDKEQDNKLIRFVLGGKCTSIHIYDNFAIIE